KPVLPENLGIEDKWILSKYNTAVKEITANLDKFELGVASAKIYEFVWDVLCDWYIELIKPRLFEKGTPSNKDAQSVLLYVLSGTLKLLHPFMPFITECIWSHLGYEKPLITAEWPKYDSALDFTAECAAMERVIGAIRAVRNVRAQMNVPPSKKAKLYIVSDYTDSFNADTAVFFTRLASASEVAVVPSYEDNGSVSVVSEGAKLYIPMAEIVDVEKERARLEKEKANALSEIDRLTKKLSNSSFTEKAPAAVVETERAKLDKYTGILKNVEEMLAQL
ncbi:MAG: class I tRNA ligase family protein, partial [Eubacteriales bacterium]